MIYKISPVLIKVKILILFSICFLGCGQSKKQLTEELFQRKRFWQSRMEHYSSLERNLMLERFSSDNPPPPSDSEQIYNAITDTAVWQLDKIDDSLLKLTGKWYGPNK